MNKRIFTSLLTEGKVPHYRWNEEAEIKGIHKLEQSEAESNKCTQSMWIKN